LGYLMCRIWVGEFMDGSASALKISHTLTLPPLMDKLA